MEDATILEGMVGGIVKDPNKWKAVLPAFVTELYAYDEDTALKLTSELIDIALNELGQEEYNSFFETLFKCMTTLPENVRRIIITSDMLAGPKDNAAESEKARLGILNFLGKTVLNNKKEDIGTLKFCIETLALLEEDEAISIFGAIMEGELKLNEMQLVNTMIAIYKIVCGLPDEIISRYALLIGKAEERFFTKEQIKRLENARLRAFGMLGKEDSDHLAAIFGA